MDIYNYLEKDHRKVSKLLEEVVNTNNPKLREEILQEIQHELIQHADTEQATFYAALEGKKLTEEYIQEAKEEHAEIKKYLQKLSRLPAKSEEWLELFGEFKHAVEHHVKEEEEIIFKKAKKILSDEEATRLAEKMDILKEKFMKKAA